MDRRFVNAYLVGNQLVTIRRDEEGALHRATMRPEYVVYLRADQVDDDLRRQVSASRWIASFRAEGEWLRVGFVNRFAREDMVFGRKGRDPHPSPFEARNVEVFEGDVSPVRRWMTDSGAKIQRPRRCFLDIETDSRVPFARKEEARVLCWCVVDPNGERVSGVLREETDADERRLLEELWGALAVYDQVCAWYGDGFDFPVIKARTAALGATLAGRPVEADRWLWLDQLAVYKKMNAHAAESGDEKQSMALGAIATALLGEGKHDFDASEIYGAWRDEEKRGEMVAYCEQDTDLLRRIEEKTGFVGLLDVVADLCGIFPDTHALAPTHQMDGYMLRLGLAAGVHFPTKRYRQEIERYQGAFVMEPQARGIERDVHVADFASLYPTIMLTFNMSPETIVEAPINGPIVAGTCRAPSGSSFRVDVPGLLSTAIKDVLAERKKWKAKKAALPPGTSEWVDADRISNALKIIVNSFYGVIGSSFSRFFNRRIAEGVTKTGRWLLEHVMSAASSRGWVPIYADTDSVYVKGCSRTAFDEFVRWCNESHFPELLRERGCVENHVRLAYEKQFARIAFVSAKRYAGAFAHYEGKAATADSKPEVKGLEYKRGDTNKVARVMQERIILEVIGGGRENASACRAIVEETMRYVLNDPLPIEHVQLSKSLSRPLREYSSKKKLDGEDAAQPPHVRVAKILADRGEDVREGTRIAYVIAQDDIAIPAKDYKGECDRYYLWESLVYPPTQRFLRAAFPDHDWATGLEKVRPPKLRASRAPRGFDGQLGLESVAAAGAFEIVIAEDEGGALEAIKAAAIKHRGASPLVVKIRLTSGAIATIDTRMSVAPSAELSAAIASLLLEARGRKERDESCAR